MESALFEKNHEYFMTEALKEARKALEKEEVPIGAVVSISNALDIPHLNHKINVISGIPNDQCAEIMSEFFQRVRNTR